MRKLLVLFLALAAVHAVRAYDGKYDPGDYWSIEEDFLKNNEGAGFYKQGDYKEQYDSNDEVWFYLTAAPGDGFSDAVALPQSGFSPRGAGWASEQAPADETSDHRIDGYPFVVRGYGTLEKQIFTHPGKNQDLIIAFQAPVEGQFSISSSYQRLSNVGDGQEISWFSANGDVLRSESADGSMSPIKTELPKVSLKKGERIYLRVTSKESSEEDMGAVSIKITYSGK
jgi:hypothetical protein